MKNYITFLFGTLFMLSSCNNTQSVPETVETTIGIEIADDGTRLPLISGDLSTIEVWENYIKAHNERDLETIKEIEKITNNSCLDIEFGITNSNRVVIFQVRPITTLNSKSIIQSEKIAKLITVSKNISIKKIKKKIFLGKK